MKAKQPVWNVYYYNLNSGTVCIKNVFSFGPVDLIIKELKKMIKKHYKEMKECTEDADKKQAEFSKELSEKLKNELLYYFWSKCEYEVLVEPWPPHYDIDEAQKYIKEMVEKHGENWFFKRELAEHLADKLDCRQSIKVDVYKQIMLNYPSFEKIVFDYIGFNE